QEEAGRRDGFIERILWSWPDPRVAEWSEAEIGTETKEAVAAVFGKLRAARRAEAPVRLHPDAKREWVRWFDENKRLTASATGITAGVYSKLDIQCARLTLILHCLTYPEKSTSTLVSVETMTAAITLAEYFRQHAHRVLTRFGQPTSR